MKKKLHKLIREENFLSLAGNLVIALLGIAGFGVLARTLPVDEFGQWVLFLAGGSFIEMFRFGITNTGLIRYLSGAGETERARLIGSNAVIGLVSTLLVVVLLWGSALLFSDAISHSGYALFFRWYPVLALVNLPWNNALVVLQADRKFGKILLLKSFNSVPFFTVLLLNLFFFHLTLTTIVWINLLINAITSGISLLKGWDGFNQIRYSTKETRSTLLHFGKYTTFTLVGTNLLRSADTFIISLSPMGNAAVALYSIPLKLTELQQIPLRSFTATAFPKMSKASLEGDNDQVRRIFYSYAGALTYLFVAMSLFTFVFAEFFVWILAGKQFLTADPVTGFSVVAIVRVFSIYGLLLPVDRMTGIGLDSINKPQVNARKVFYMVAANIAGDLIAVYVFHSLVMVAIGSILFTMLGIWIGMQFLDKELHLGYRPVFTEGINFYKELFKKFQPGKSQIPHTKTVKA